MGRAETKRLLESLAESHPKLVEELVPKILSLGEVQRVLQQLLREQVSIRDLGTILEALVETAALGVAAAVFFVGGLVLLCMGVLGEYLGRVYDEVRNRPLSIVSKVHFSAARTAVPVGMIAMQGSNYRDNDEATEAA